MAQVSTPAVNPSKTFMDRVLDGVETLGNKVPHPVMMFVYLIVFVIVLSSLLQVLGVSVTEQVLEPVPASGRAQLLSGHDPDSDRGYPGWPGVV